MKKNQIEQIFTILSQEIPNPKTELQYVNNYTLLVAVVLSAQSTDVGVNKATKNLFAIIDTPNKMLQLGEEGLKNYIKTIGLYNAKAKNIIALSQILVDKFESQIPTNFDDLVSLPGVGRKTANVILNCAFNQETIAVDTHIFRVANRIGLTNETNVLQTELSLLKQIPSKWKKDAHHLLILHGRYICKARTPLCKICKIKELCEFKNKTA